MTLRLIFFEPEYPNVTRGRTGRGAIALSFRSHEPGWEEVRLYTYLYVSNLEETCRSRVRKTRSLINTSCYSRVHNAAYLPI